MSHYEKEQERLQRLFAEVDAVESFIDEHSENEEDCIENDILTIDTEQEGELSDEEVIRPAKVPKTALYMGKDGSTNWRKHINQNVRIGRSNIVIHLPGVKPDKSAKCPLDCWNYFFTETMLDSIVKNTNQMIILAAPNYARNRAVRPTDITEIKALLGLLYLAGCLKGSSLSVDELWDKRGTGVERFWLTMSKERFLLLLKHLRFDDRETRDQRKAIDKLAPIRDLFTSFVDNCKDTYTISEYATIDEKFEPFRGRCSFKQYITNKPNKYGIKMFALADARTCYVHNLEVYVGVQPEGPYRVPNDATSVVERLIQPISKTGRNITCANWFTSFPLITKLEKEHNLTLVGTVLKNKRELPNEFVNTKQRPVNSSIFGFHEKTTIVSYVPKKGKNIIIASSMHYDDTIDLSTGASCTPEILTFYNMTKNGVDTVDKLSATYNVARNTRRWPMVIFFSLLNIAGINSQIICSANNSKEISIRRIYLKELALALTENYLKRRAELTNVPIEIRQRRQEIAGTSATTTEVLVIPPGTRKRCNFCKISRKSQYYCVNCKKFVCLEHAVFSCRECQYKTSRLSLDWGGKQPC